MNKRLALMGIIVLLLTPLVTLQPAIVKAQSSTSPPATQWQKLFGSGSSESVSNLIQTSDGGYAFLDLGKSYEQSLFIPSTLFKLDSSGNVQWNKTIKLFTASNLIQTSDGGYEVAGEWNTYGITYPTTEPLNQTTPTLIKLNSKGDMQWYENTSTVLNLAIVSSNIQTSDGGFVYFEPANSNGFPTFVSFPTLVKTDSNNDTHWIENFTYSGPANYYNGTITFPFKIFSIIETSDGALACLGIANSYLNQGYWGFIYLMKTSPFLPLPSQSPLPTPLPSPTPSPTMITVNEQILIIALIAIVVALSVVLLIYRRHRKDR
jgi:hypothetical protein